MSAPVMIAPAEALAVNTRAVSGQTNFGVTVTDDDNNVVLPRSTAGVSEMPPGSGSYFATVLAPAASGSYRVVWDNAQVIPFIVSKAMNTPFSHEEPRGFGLIKKQPRGYDLAARSVYSMLVDEASVVREDDGGLVVDGTPVLTPVDYGPYACRISPVERSESRDADRYVATVSHTLQIATDLIIVESDLFDIVCQDPTRSDKPGVTLRYRAVSGVQPRTPGWRAPLIWHVPVQLTEEY